MIFVSDHTSQNFMEKCFKKEFWGYAWTNTSLSFKIVGSSLFCTLCFGNWLYFRLQVTVCFITYIWYIWRSRNLLFSLEDGSKTNCEYVVDVTYTSDTQQCPAQCIQGTVKQTVFSLEVIAKSKSLFLILLLIYDKTFRY